MPRATAPTDTERFDLKSLEGGWVELRHMRFGESVKRRAMLKLQVATSGAKGRNLQGEMAMGSEAITQFEFAHCIVSHNLEKDDSGTLFNFADPVDFATLDSRVGQEIEGHIEEMNSFESEELGD